MTYTIENITQEEILFLLFNRRLVDSSGVNLCTADNKDLRMLACFKYWRGLGQDWDGLVSCRGGIITFKDTKPRGKIMP